MMRIAGRVLAVVIVCGAVAPVFAADRPPAEILKELGETKPPRFAQKPGEDRQKAVEAYLAEMKKVNAKRIDLIGELKKSDPENAELAKLMLQRWAMLAQEDKADIALAEIDETLAKTKDEPYKLEALYAKAQVTYMKNQDKPSAAAPAFEAFLKAAPKTDKRVPSLLSMLADFTEDATKKTELEDRLVKEFPDSPATAGILGARKQKASIGKPFELEFNDAIKETSISMKGLKGKVVVVDFWATWCGPCVAEMPTMKKLYAEYKDKGVEFIGVSLDKKKEDGGLDKLKEFVAKNDIQWPQYYQGNWWESEFSKGWGINGIPCVFIVDANGNLYSVEARGKLDKMIPELLEKAKAAPGAGGE